MSAHVLIVEDDKPLATLMAQQLSQFGHTSRIVPDGRDAVLIISREAFDVVILDRMLPRMDGITVLHTMREAGISLPVMMLTALGQSDQKVEGLDAGADDYIVKPVEPEELNARIRALMRARRWKDEPSEQTVQVGDIVISPVRHFAWRNGTLLNVHNIEFRLLLALARNPGMAMTRQMLLEQVWNYDFDPGTNLVDAYIRRLRVKLMEFGGDDPIRTIRGVGYLLQD